jgi:hypothetical protein
MASAMRALSVRQPWAELILRGDKTIECRSRPTRILGRVYIYASLGPAHAAPLGPPVGDTALPRGLLVGSVEIIGCRELRRSDRVAACVVTSSEGYAWLLARPERLVIPRRPTRHPQPVFFYPFEQIQQ